MFQIDNNADEMDKNEQLIKKNTALNVKKREREKTSNGLSFHIIMKRERSLNYII